MAIPSEIKIIKEVRLCDEGERDEFLEIRAHGGTFGGVKTRNTFVEDVNGTDRKMAYLLQPGAITRWWGGIGRPVHQIEVLVKDKDVHPMEPSDDSLYGDWVVVWDVTNDFRTLEESQADMDSYVAFIEREAAVIAERIDAGESPETAYENLDADHSGNTAAWAWTLGCDKAKDQDRAQTFRDFWNRKWAPDQPVAAGKTVNPAVLVVGKEGATP